MRKCLPWGRRCSNDRWITSRRSGVSRVAAMWTPPSCAAHSESRSQKPAPSLSRCSHSSLMISSLGPSPRRRRATSATSRGAVCIRLRSRILLPTPPIAIPVCGRPHPRWCNSKAMCWNGCATGWGFPPVRAACSRRADQGRRSMRCSAHGSASSVRTFGAAPSIPRAKRISAL